MAEPSGVPSVEDVLAVEPLCELMHDAYEKAAVGAGWETNPASRKPWSDVPEANKATMRAAVSALVEHVTAGLASVLAEARAEDRATIQTLQAAYREAIGVPASQHQRERLERMAADLEAARAELAALRARRSVPESEGRDG